jgi:spore coat polysaccharide biosynthesis protein SpsF (cytidylyltransferase family)
MIELLLNRVSNTKLVDEIIVATSINIENDILVECVNKLGFKIYRGSENDVLDRLKSM